MFGGLCLRTLSRPTSSVETAIPMSRVNLVPEDEPHPLAPTSVCNPCLSLPCSFQPEIAADTNGQTNGGGVGDGPVEDVKKEGHEEQQSESD